MQDTNLNITPYFDDFDSSKNYQKVLFKPGFSVQTRELNTLQSILQNQVEKFGQHVFKDGSLVIPGNVNYNLSLSCVLVQPFINGISVESYRETLIGKTLTGVSSGVKAEVVETLSQSESEKDTITLYITYNYGGIVENGAQVTKFKNNETLIDENGVSVAVTSVQNASAYVGSTANINPGVYFVRGFFVEVGSQRIILSQYDNVPSAKVGLQINESIATVDEDETLFDNSLGSTNYSAPGADRLKIDLKLVKQDLVFTDNSNFIELLRFENGNVVESAAAYSSIYSELEKNLARRTFDESGSYTTKPYTVKVREALDNGSNGGVYQPNETLYDGRKILSVDPPDTPSSESSSYSGGTVGDINGNDYYAVELSEGKAYIEGFEVNNERKQYALVKKPRDVKKLNNEGIPTEIGSYVNIDGTTVKGIVTTGDELLLRDENNDTIGKARAIGFTSANRLYLVDVTIFETIQTTTTTILQTGDFITGSVSGATAFVHSKTTAGGKDTIILRQTTGSFLDNESIEISRYTSGSNPVVESSTKNLLENVRSVISNTSSNQFQATIKLDSVRISGSSFTVTGQSLTGIDTAFLQEVSVKSRLKIADQTPVEVDTVTGPAIVITGSTPAGTYYNVFKQVCKLNSSSDGLTTRISSSPVKSEHDAIHSRLVSSSSYTTNSQGDFTLQTPSGTIDTASIVVTTDTEVISGLDFSIVESNVIIVRTGLANKDKNVNVYYRNQVGNPTHRLKSKQDFKFLEVNKVKASDSVSNSSNVYGTRISDKEISLKYPDVIKIRNIRTSIKDGDSATDMYDKLVLNDSSLINVGDTICSGNIKAQVVFKSTSNTVYVLYTSNTKFESGINLAIPIEVKENASAVGIFIKQSFYGRYVDITNNFKFIRNDGPDFYRTSKLVRKPQSTIPTKKIVVLFDYFEHQNLTGDFYSIESYCPDMMSDNMYYEEIPSSYNGVPMADQLDFRYYLSPSESSGTTGTINSPFVESGTYSAFDIKQKSIATGQNSPYPGTIFSTDYEFYLGRVDKVYLTTSPEKYGAYNGLLRVIEGSSSVEPLGSEDKSAGLLLATITLPPYLKKVSDAKLKLEETRNYTMRDIGKLEERLSNVEKYTSLSLLEVDTNNLNILDQEGRNRFKNGFVVDSFTTTDVADLLNPDYTSSIDLDKNLARPYPYVNNIGLNFDSTNSTAFKNDTYVTIPYEETSFITQPYSSRVENLLPYEVFSWIGAMEVIPKKDIWYDTQRTIEETQNINLADPFESLLDLVVPGGQIWGGWQRGAGGTSRNRRGRTVTDIRTGTQFGVDALNFEIESETIDSITDIRFTRSRIVNINSTGLKPNTNFFFYINERESSSNVYPKLLRNLDQVQGNFVLGETVSIIPIRDDEITLQVIPNRPLKATVILPTILDDSINLAVVDKTILAIDQIRSEEGSDIDPIDIGDRFLIMGDSSGASARSNIKQELISDQYGNLSAFVLIPPLTFETGDLTFSISDLSDNVQIKGISGSYATGYYYSQGTELQVTTNVTTLEVPELTETTITQERTRFIPNPPPQRRHDPIAQSFFVDEEGGIFVTSLDLFFLTKDEISPVIIDIRTVENGSPTSYVIPGSNVSVAASDINTSIDASIPSKFEFKNPLYLSSNSDYVFVVRSTSKKYNMWVSRLGEEDVTTGLKIDKQPYVGVLYKSANQSIWTPDQYEDVKFVLNRAQFTTNETFSAVLSSKKIEPQKLITNPFTFTTGSSSVKVFQPNHCMHQTGNLVKISNVFSDTPNAQLGNTPSLTSNATTIILKDITGSSFNPLDVGSWNKINNLAVSADNPGFIKIDNEIISYTGVTNTGNLTGCTRGVLNTAAVVHSTGDTVQCFQNNGIVLSNLNTIHTVSKVNSLDEYEIIVQTSANDTKKSGESGVLASRNIQYENLTPNFNMFSPVNTSVVTNFTSISGTSIGSNQNSFEVLGQEGFENNQENVLTSPRLILSETNRLNFVPSQDGTLISTINLSTTNDRLSPVIDLSGSSIVTISNRLNKEVDDKGDLDLNSELSPFGGKHSAYITKKVLLETTSTSVKVLFDGVRTINNDIKVFVKVKGDSTSESFNNMNYIEIPAISYPVSETRNDYRAFDFEIKGLLEFQEFSIKLVMIGNDQSNCPKIRNFRALALAL